MLSILPANRDHAVPWPSDQEKQRLADHLTAQLADLELFARSFVEAVCYVFEQATALAHGPVQEWNGRYERAAPTLTIQRGIGEFDT
jgi:hypothetical protein